MEFEINHTPFEMKDISERLFNSPFLSDVTFDIEGKLIFAHSFELMKRSCVFQTELLPTLGTQKHISIVDYGYDTYYQFIRFIYTDEYTVTNENHFELLKLAKVYNVIRLINVLLNYSDNHIEKLNFCVVENHEIALNCTKIQVAYNLSEIMKSDVFVTIHADTVEQILKLDHIKNDVTENDIVDALVRWMNNHCIQNRINFTECRQKFDKLVRLVRFGALPIEDRNTIRTKYPDLVQNIYDSPESMVWNSTPRKQFIWGYERRSYSDDLPFKTTFTVSSDMILGGFVFGRCSKYFQYIDVTVSCRPTRFYEVNEINMNGKVEVFTCSSVVMSLGRSIRVRPKLVYTISYKMHHRNDTDPQSYYCARKPQTKLFINAPSESVQILEAHDTMHEILFLTSEGCNFD